MGGVCAGSHKTFACRVFRRHASARFLPECWFHTKFIICIPPLFFLVCFYRWILKQVLYRNRVYIGGEVRPCKTRAGKPLWGECSSQISFFVVCSNFFHAAAAAAASLRVCWKFWDFWHILHFPAAELLNQSFTCLVDRVSCFRLAIGAASNYSDTSSGFKFAVCYGFWLAPKLKN